jgi:hypothetical protein
LIFAERLVSLRSSSHHAIGRELAFAPGRGSHDPTTMRILLQQKQTGHYFKTTGAWTREPGEGMDFISSTHAIEYCIANKLSDVQLVLKFEEQHYDIVLPMVTDRRHHASVQDRLH